MNKLIKIILLILLLFSFGWVFLFFLKPQTIEASGVECNNGPNNHDGGGCGAPCYCGQPWTLYNKDTSGESICRNEGNWFSFISKISTICPTGNVCRPGEYGLRPGYCDCSFGPIYKACCSGSTPVQCESMPGYNPVWLKGRCPPGTSMTEAGVTTCPSAPPPGPGPTSPPGATPTSAPPSGATPTPGGGGGGSGGSITIC